MGFHTVSGDSTEHDNCPQQLQDQEYRHGSTDCEHQPVLKWLHRKLTSACTSTEAWLMGINMASGHSTDYGHPNVLR